MPAEAEPPAFVVRQDSFEGSLGELAHALRRGAVAPGAIDLLALVKAYLEHFDSFSEFDLEIASSALPNVAQVIELKLRLLLPRPPVSDVEGEEDEALDEALEAVAMLEELEDAIDFLRQRRDQRRLVLPAQAPRPEYPRPRRKLGTGIEDLARLASRYRSHGYFELAVDRLTMGGAIDRLVASLSRWRRGVFAQLVERPDWPQLTVYFAGMLELVREGRVTASQAEPYAEIVLELVELQAAEVA